MFGLGMTEIMVVLIIALIVFGPKKLPEIGRGLGKAIREFKTAGSEITRTLNAEPPPQLPQQEQPPPPKPPEN
jgi:sec-independent protein translocase protein TatA